MLIRSPETAGDIRAVAPLFDAYRVFTAARPIRRPLAIFSTTAGDCGIRGVHRI